MKNPTLRVRSPLLWCCVALLSTACASKPEDLAAAATDPAAERVCRGTATAGSKMRRTTCRTAEEWAIIDARTRAREDSQDEFFRRAAEGASLGPGPSFPSATSPRL